jgi:hypothetical protein
VARIRTAGVIIAEMTLIVESRSGGANCIS